MIKNQLHVLMAQKSVADGKRVTLNTISEATGINPSTLSRMSTQQLQEYKLRDLDALCCYFNCALSDLLEHSPAIPISHEQ